jgi:hypothetical protein
MKTGLLTALVLAFSTQVFAQGVGIEAGVSMNSLRGDIGGTKISSSMRPQIRAGVVASELLSDRLSFQYGAFYAAKGGNINYSSSFIDNGATVEQSTDGFLRVDYAEIPLSLVYNTETANKGKFFIGAGPYIGLAFGGVVGFTREFSFNNTVKRLEVLYPATVGDDENDDFKFFDAGLHLHLGYELPKGFYTKANISYGLTNINPTENTLKNNSIGLTIGYMIR